MYTKRHHAYNLLKFLSKKSNENLICETCCIEGKLKKYKSGRHGICGICMNFIDNPNKDEVNEINRIHKLNKNYYRCPCNQEYGQGSEEKDIEYQLKHTWLKIEEILGEIK